MDKNSMNLEVKVNVTNMDQFNDLVKEFNKKAHELEELAHELNWFRFEADILSNDGNQFKISIFWKQINWIQFFCFEITELVTKIIFFGI